MMLNIFLAIGLYFSTATAWLVDQEEPLIYIWEGKYQLQTI
jgi:hypothetical protein